MPARMDSAFPISRTKALYSSHSSRPLSVFGKIAPAFIVSPSGSSRQVRSGLSAIMYLTSTPDSAKASIFPARIALSMSTVVL